MPVVRKGQNATVARPPAPPPAAAVRQTLGLGSAATLDATEFAGAVHTHLSADITDLAPGGGGLTHPQILARGLGC